MSKEVTVPRSRDEQTAESIPSLAIMPDLAERVLRYLSFGVMVFDRNLQVVYRNEAAAILLPEEEKIAETLRARTIESHYQDWGSELREAIETRREKVFEAIGIRTETGEERLLNLLCTPLSKESSGETIGGVLVLEDVTWRAGMEKRLAVSERLAAVGKLAARVAHELSNPLDGILRYINLTKRVVTQAHDTEKATHYLEEAGKGLMRMVQILRELMEFSRNTATADQEGNINQIVEEAIRSMGERPTTQGVAVVCDFQEPMPTIPGSNLFQVFCNLIKNALDAMPGGGTLSVLTRRSGADVIVNFADTGPGLPDDPERVFEPFFTTKEPGKGTGLGLPISRDIVEKYRGTLTAGKREGGGAIFTVRLPAERVAALRDLGHPMVKQG